MNCKNCGAINNMGSKFCIKCGQSLDNLTSMQSNIEQPVQQPTIPTQTVDNMSTQNINSFQTVVNQPQPTNNSVNSNISSNKISFMDYYFIILAVILKPFTAFKEELSKFSEFKNSAILSLVVAGTATIVNLLISMLNAVRVTSYWSDEVTWAWENLKELDYLQVIGKNFLIYLGAIAIIAAIYYIVSLIMKKQLNFSRLLGISTISVVPILVCTLMLSPLLGMIWTQLSLPVTLIGAVYTIVLLYEGMNNEIVLEGNMKYYFNLICLSILLLVIYYIGMRFIVSSIAGGFGDMMDLFG